MYWCVHGWTYCINGYMYVLMMTIESIPVLKNKTLRKQHHTHIVSRSGITPDHKYVQVSGRGPRSCLRIVATVRRLGVAPDLVYEYLQTLTHGISDCQYIYTDLL